MARLQIDVEDSVYEWLRYFYPRRMGEVVNEAIVRYSHTLLDDVRPIDDSEDEGGDHNGKATMQH